MTPRVLPAIQRPRRSFEAWREDGEAAPVEARAFWRYCVQPPLEGVDPREMLREDERALLEEVRVLSKGASGGGYLVPTDLAEAVVAAARASSAVMQVARTFQTSGGETLGIPLGSTLGSGAWVAESGSYTPSDVTLTQASLSAFKGGTKILVSEELRTDSAVDLEAYLAAELGGRLGALANAAMSAGDGSGKPAGLTHASSPYSTVTAASGSTTRFTPSDIRAIFKGLAPAYVPLATWMLHPSDYVELAALADSPGFASLAFDPPSLLSRPVILNPDLPSPAANARSLVFGAFEFAYGVRLVDGLTVQRQDELSSDSGQVGFRAAWRVDGRPLLSAAAVIGVHSAT